VQIPEYKCCYGEGDAAAKVNGVKSFEDMLKA
jgi:uncharacterized protein YunC (DUF1805 family)